jgi:hypothetical protein
MYHETVTPGAFTLDAHHMLRNTLPMMSATASDRMNLSIAAWSHRA